MRGTRFAVVCVKHPYWEVFMRPIHVVACAAVGAGLLFVSAESTVSAQSPGERQEMRQVFQKRIDDYVRLHRELEQLVPPEVVTSDLTALFGPRTGLARELRKARASARQGDIFTPDVSVFFRVVIAETTGWNGLLNPLAEDEETVCRPAVVNGDYPAGRSMPFIPTGLLAAMPSLPEELRYSFVGRDLILWDLHAGLIVDVVDRALPEFTSVSARTDSCCAHCCGK
jgi:hypothetical protein